MKDLKEKLNSQEINETYENDIKRMKKKMKDAWVNPKIIDIVENTNWHPDGYVKVEDLVDILCILYSERFD